MLPFRLPNGFAYDNALDYVLHISAAPAAKVEKAVPVVEAAEAVVEEAVVEEAVVEPVVEAHPQANVLHTVDILDDEEPVVEEEVVEASEPVAVEEPAEEPLAISCCLRCSELRVEPPLM